MRSSTVAGRMHTIVLRGLPGPWHAAAAKSNSLLYLFDLRLCGSTVQALSPEAWVRHTLAEGPWRGIAVAVAQTLSMKVYLHLIHGLQL